MKKIVFSILFVAASTSIIMPKKLSKVGAFEYAKKYLSGQKNIENSHLLENIIMSKILDLFGRQTQRDETSIQSILDEAINEAKFQQEIETAEMRSLDDGLRLAKIEEIYTSNKQDLSDFTKRFLERQLTQLNIFYVRSLQQINSWLCGHFVLFNTLHIQDHLQNAKVLDTRVWNSKIKNLPAYKYDEFKNFQTNDSFKAYKNKLLEVDPVSGFKKPMPEDPKNENEFDYYLTDQELRDYALQKKNFNFFILHYTVEYGIESVFSDSRLDPYINVQEPFRKNLEDIAQTIDKPTNLNFFCNVDGNHWILISVYLGSNDPHDRKILIVNSYNKTFEESPGMVPYLKFLVGVFMPYNVLNFNNIMNGLPLESEALEQPTLPSNVQKAKTTSVQANPWLEKLKSAKAYLERNKGTALGVLMVPVVAGLIFLYKKWYGTQ